MWLLELLLGLMLLFPVVSFPESPSPPNSSSISLMNATSMVILSAVIASVVSEAGLCSEPAFKVPYYDFRSPAELPLYLLLGVLCGLVSLTCTSYMLVFVDNLHKTVGLPIFFFPIVGGLAIGLMALAYPEILYRGFENVDILLEFRPLEKGLSADQFLQLVVVKIGATSLCRDSGLVGASGLVQQQEWHTENSSVLQFSVQSYISSFPYWKYHHRKHTAWLEWVLVLQESVAF